MTRAATEALLAWEVRAHGVTAHYAATTRGRARTLCARVLVECGYDSTMGDAYRSIQCNRAPWRDADALAIGREGGIGG